MEVEFPDQLTEFYLINNITEPKYSQYSVSTFDWQCHTLELLSSTLNVYIILYTKHSSEGKKIIFSNLYQGNVCSVTQIEGSEISLPVGSPT